MKTVLLILGKETNDFAKGAYNHGLFDAATHSTPQKNRKPSSVAA